MVDLFPFPSTHSSTPEGQIRDILNYLIQFKEILEFALTNISAENLSPDLISKLNELGSDIVKSNEDREEQIAQITSSNLSVSDVVNSQVFKEELNEAVSNVKFTVNLETGHLEYSIT